MGPTVFAHAFNNGTGLSQVNMQVDQVQVRRNIGLSVQHELSDVFQWGINCATTLPSMHVFGADACIVV